MTDDGVQIAATCPHLFGGALCPFAISTRCGPLHGDPDQCPSNFGEFGTWRSVVEGIAEWIACGKNYTESTGDEYYYWFGEVRAMALLKTAGWTA